MLPVETINKRPSVVEPTSSIPNLSPVCSEEGAYSSCHLINIYEFIVLEKLVHSSWSHGGFLCGDFISL